MLCNSRGYNIFIVGCNSASDTEVDPSPSQLCVQNWYNLQPMCDKSDPLSHIPCHSVYPTDKQQHLWSPISNQLLMVLLPLGWGLRFVRSRMICDECVPAIRGCSLSIFQYYCSTVWTAVFSHVAIAVPFLTNNTETNLRNIMKY